MDKRTMQDALRHGFYVAFEKFCMAGASNGVATPETLEAVYGAMCIQMQLETIKAFFDGNEENNPGVDVTEEAFDKALSAAKDKAMDGVDDFVVQLGAVIVLADMARIAKEKLFQNKEED